MARPKKIVETPGQEKAAPEEKTLVTEGQLITAEQNGAQQQGNGSGEETVQQKVSTLLDGTQLAERNAILATLNAQGAAIVARFEEYAFTDIVGHPLTNCLDFLDLVRKATDLSTGGTAEQVTNEEGKKQPVRSAPVLTEHGWHVPG
ncbi:TPA: hypothetical protein RQO33_000257 [Klebsiella michiganensis]|nr:hypothetical protein [Klebsiella michiganensis]EMA4700879.1 hypothetical protein [Klebsiella pneumoniae]EKV5141441.1 hypothetical protein [Klebsiella michiganensis]MBA4425258.1 hypothetical protein [Klebsiella michiganensis]HBQ2354234.1 hypothetical protein [Klebsiella pneumoniae]HBV3844918.1 hypothetical protein [Klebsiella pneumoniae]